MHSSHRPFVNRILVTGGSGFIGQHLVAALVARGQQVTILDPRPPRPASPGLCDPGSRDPTAHHIAGSVLDPERVHEALEGVDEVYHLAALPGMWVPRRDDFHAVNSSGTARILAAARQRGVSRCLHCSTESILFGGTANAGFAETTPTSAGDMAGAYTLSKWEAEQHALQAAAAGLPVVIANPTMPIGPHDHGLTPPTAMLCYFLRRRIQFYFDFVLNLVDVRDVAAGLILAMERGRPGERYILGGENLSLRALLDQMAAITGRSRLCVPVPAALARMTAAAMEFIADRATGRAPAATVEGVRIAMRSHALSIEKSRRDLGYSPRPVEEALRDTIAWIERSH